MTKFQLSILRDNQPREGVTYEVLPADRAARRAGDDPRARSSDAAQFLGRYTGEAVLP